MDPKQIEIVVKIAIAMILGALIGLDREAANKPAGLRTHILVAGAAAALISIGEVIVQDQVDAFGNSIVGSNPVRMVAAIITGISFLGAGTIIRDRSEGHIKGLTTAASLLFASVIGMSVAVSQWVIALGATILVLIILRLIPWAEQKIKA
jgi:putative Mg2+ transporter-C (MgtC) family protein